MSATVNLVPTACLHRFARSARLRAWIATLVCVILFVPVGWAIRRAREKSVDDLAAQLALASTRIAALAVERAAVAEQRGALLERAKLLRRLHEQPVLLTAFQGVARATPDGVWLTSLRSGRTEGMPVPALSDPAASAATGAGDVFVEGLARNHGTLTAFIEDLRAIRGVGDVQLTQVRKEPRLGDDGIQFQLKCTAAEVRS